MEKAMFRRYIFFMITIILFLSIAFFYFTIFDLIKYEKKDILNVVNICKNIKNFNLDDEDFKKIFKDVDLTISILDKDGKIYISTDENIDFIKSFDKNLIKNFLNNKEQNFQFNNNKLCYINYFNSSEKFIIIYKEFYILEVILFNILFSSILVFFISYLYIYFIKNKIKKDFILPIKNISKEIMLIQKNVKKPQFIETKYEEINDIYKAINLISDKTEGMVCDIKAQNIKIEYILDNMNEGFLLLDRNKRVFTINKMARKILQSSNEILGENILYYTQNMKIIEAIEKLYDKKENSIFDIKTEDNKIYSVYISSIEQHIFQDEGNGGIILLIDVTAERETQIIKQEFFSNVSHELKTPITSIQGYAELLYNDFAKTKEQEKEFLKRIQKESQNITEMINNILTISKLENKYIEINQTNIKINHIVEEIIQATKPLCLENNIQLFNKCENIEIFADYKMLHQLFNNLIVNAIKYNKRNGIVEIKCFEDDKNININIKDTGIGIPFKDKRRIFERFYRVEKGRSKNLGGSGLGLAIVKHIVNYYNGTIKIKSKENIGTEFLLKIPKK